MRAARWPHRERIPRTLREAERRGWHRCGGFTTYDSADVQTGIVHLTKTVGQRRLRLNVTYRMVCTYDRPRSPRVAGVRG